MAGSRAVTGEDDPGEEEPVASATYGNKSPCIRTGDQYQAEILPALVPSTCLERGDTLVWSATCMGAAGMGGVALDAYLRKSLALVGGPPQQPPTYTSAQLDFPIELALAALHACGGDAAAALAQLQRSSGGSGEAWSTVEVRRLHAALARSKTVDLRSVRDHVKTKDLKAVVRYFYVVDGERKKEHRDKERERYDLEQGGQAHPDAPMQHVDAPMQHVVAELHQFRRQGKCGGGRGGDCGGELALPPAAAEAVHHLVGGRSGTRSRGEPDWTLAALLDEQHMLEQSQHGLRGGGSGVGCGVGGGASGSGASSNASTTATADNPKMARQLELLRDFLPTGRDDRAANQVMAPRESERLEKLNTARGLTSWGCVCAGHLSGNYFALPCAACDRWFHARCARLDYGRDDLVRMREERLYTCIQCESKRLQEQGYHSDAGRFVWSCRFCSRAFEDESSATVHGKRCTRDDPQQADRLPPCMLMASLIAC